MSEVNIYKDDKDRWHVEVDGVDLAGAIKNGGLSVEFPPWPDLPLVHLTLRARKFNATLPQATVEAVEDLLADGDA